MTTAAVYDVGGIIYEHVEIVGYHQVIIINEGETVQWFKYMYQLWVDGIMAGYMVRNVDLTPGSMFSAEDMTIGDLNKVDAGEYPIKAVTQTWGLMADSISESTATGHIFRSK